MRRFLTFAIVLVAALFFALPGALAAGQQESGNGNVVIVFKDGHRQSIPLGDVERMEFPGPVPAGLLSIPGPSRARLVGKWEVGEGNGDNFTITLKEDGTAWRSLGHEHGTWRYNNGAAEITWDDGWQDAIRKVDGSYKKYAYSEGKTFLSEPDNVTNARNVTENPRGVD